MPTGLSVRLVRSLRSTSRRSANSYAISQVMSCLSQTHDGTMVLDLAGERLVNHYDFYAGFTSPDEWKLLTNGPEPSALSPLRSP